MVRVLTDNGSCYRSKIFAKPLADAVITHKRTRPYRPQTNGKVERFNRTMLEEWAYEPAARVRLKAMTASTSQAEFAVNEFEGKWARAELFRSAWTCSMIA